MGTPVYMNHAAGTKHGYTSTGGLAVLYPEPEPLGQRGGLRYVVRMQSRDILRDTTRIARSKCYSACLTFLDFEDARASFRRMISER